jgi:YVTN family beta-propeller protein
MADAGQPHPACVRHGLCDLGLAIRRVDGIVVAAGQQLLRLDEDEAGVEFRDSEAFAEASVILLSDYAKGVVSDGLIAAALKTAHETGAAVIVDPKGRDFARYGAVDVIKPNASELAGATGLLVETDAEVETALAALLAATTAKAIVVTRAGKGMSLMRRGGPVRHFPGRAREVFDVSGGTPRSIRKIKTAAGAHAFRSAGDRQHVFVSNRVGNTISQIDFHTLEVVASFPAPGGPDCMDLSADGRWLLVTSRWARKLTVIDTAARKVVRQVKVGTSPHGVWTLDHAAR